MELKQELIKYGLKGKKLNFYLILLEAKQGTVRDLAAKANIKRTTAYNLIRQLVAAGLAKTAKDGKKTLILAECPDKIRQNLSQKLGLLDQILPELNKIYEAKTEMSYSAQNLSYQQFEVFCLNLLKINPSQNFYLFLNSQDSWPNIQKIFSTQSGLTQRLLIIANQAASLDLTIDQIKYQNKGDSINSANLLITDDIITLLPKNQTADCLVIKNPELATILANTFLSLWELLPMA